LFSPQVTEKKETGIPEELKPYAKAAASFLQGRLGQTGPGWTSAFTAPMSAEERAGLAGMGRMYGGIEESGLMPSALKQWGKTVSGAYLPGANQYLTDIEAQMQQEYDRRLAGLQTQVASAGQGPGSAYARMGSEALTGYMGERGKLRFGAYESERARQAQAAQAAAMYGPALAQALMRAGALPRSLKQAEIDKAYQEMLRMWNESYRAAGMAQPIFGTQAGTATQYGTSPGMGLLSGLIQMWAGGMF
jgi:hypothetical protein